MPLYASNRSTAEFEPTPKGPQHIICCDVVDLGMVLNQQFNKLQHKIQIRWQSEKVIAKTGKPFLIIKRYTNSLNPKAALRQDLDSWMGEPLTDEQCREFDLESLLEKVGFVYIVHAPSKDGSRVYGNIQAIMPPLDNAPVMRVRDYERVCARPGYKPPQYANVPAADDEPPPHTDGDQGAPDEDPIPF